MQGCVAQRITRLTTDQKIPGSNPGTLDTFLFHFWKHHVKDVKLYRMLMGDKDRTLNFRVKLFMKGQNKQHRTNKKVRTIYTRLSLKCTHKIRKTLSLLIQIINPAEKLQNLIPIVPINKAV